MGQEGPELSTANYCGAALVEIRDSPPAKRFRTPPLTLYWSVAGNRKHERCHPMAAYLFRIGPWMRCAPLAEDQKMLRPPAKCE